MPNNKQRASRASFILTGYRDQYDPGDNLSSEERLTDLLTDLMHCCDHSDQHVCFEDALDAAYGHHGDEVSEELRTPKRDADDAECASNFQKDSEREDQKPRPSTPLLFDLLYDDDNPQKLMVKAEIVDSGSYKELAVTAFKSERPNDLLADILVTLALNEPHDLRVLVTANSDGEGDHPITIYPMRPLKDAITDEGD